jgi:transcriptional regulator
MGDRRDFLIGMTMAAMTGDGSGQGTIYIPERHSEKDRAYLLDFMEEFSFAMVVTGQPAVQITNVPTILERAPEQWGKIWWHLAKANPQNEAMRGPATIVFRGPHQYISPNWYQTKTAVPTWNFAVVHVTGNPRRIDDDAAMAAGLRRLVMRNEGQYGGGGAWDYDQIPASQLKGMRGGIVAYEMAIERVEAKFKLGQERNEQDREGVLKGLTRAPKERDLLALTKQYYSRQK